ncbi:unnamed protein product, partial [Brassica oleracea var. botrytis]
RIFLSLSFSFFPHQRYPSESRQRFRAPSHQDSNPCSHHLCHAEPLPNLASVAVCWESFKSVILAVVPNFWEIWIQGHGIAKTIVTCKKNC